EAGKMQFYFAAIDLNTTVASVIDELRSLSSDRRIEIVATLSQERTDVTADGERLKQVVRNVVGNALKFSPPDSRIHIVCEKDERFARLRVLDEGPGIPDDELNVVFDEFVQSSRTKTGAGGTGLGLPICRRIIEAHHGSIWAQNREERGCQFVFEIPLNLEHGQYDLAVTPGAHRDGEVETDKVETL
ncbi:MAG TPA: ATP-binding protein, partial [Planctomycetota bacterium]|nr:ATP-binding protein [Planctomycetota bacterium]